MNEKRPRNRPRSGSLRTKVRKCGNREANLPCSHYSRFPRAHGSSPQAACILNSIAMDTISASPGGPDVFCIRLAI